jgi:hypothetical protein
MRVPSNCLIREVPFFLAGSEIDATQNIAFVDYAIQNKDFSSLDTCATMPRPKWKRPELLRAADRPGSGKVGVGGHSISIWPKVLRPVCTGRYSHKATR